MDSTLTHGTPRDSIIRVATVVFPEALPPANPKQDHIRQQLLPNKTDQLQKPLQSPHHENYTMVVDLKTKQKKLNFT